MKKKVKQYGYKGTGRNGDRSQWGKKQASTQEGQTLNPAFYIHSTEQIHSIVAMRLELQNSSEVLPIALQVVAAIMASLGLALFTPVAFLMLTFSFLSSPASWRLNCIF